VAYKDSGECAEGVTVSLSRDGTLLAQTKTNNFGDFLLDDLEPDQSYTLILEAPGYRKKESTHTVGADSLTLPVVFLERG